MGMPGPRSASRGWGCPRLCMGGVDMSEIRGVLEGACIPEGRGCVYQMGGGRYTKGGGGNLDMGLELPSIPHLTLNLDEAPLWQT